MYGKIQSLVAHYNRRCPCVIDAGCYLHRKSLPSDHVFVFDCLKRDINRVEA